MPSKLQAGARVGLATLLKQNSYAFFPRCFYVCIHENEIRQKQGHLRLYFRTLVIPIHGFRGSGNVDLAITLGQVPGTFFREAG
jgi:hypothetical protein